MKTIIYSPFDCILKSPFGQKELSAEKCAIFDEINEDISVYPLGKSKAIPFTISPSFKSVFYKTIIHNDCRLIFLLDGHYVQTVQVYNFSNNGKPAKVEISTKEIHFSTNNTRKIFHLTQEFDSFACNKVHHIVYAVCSNTENALFIAFNTINGRLKTFDAEKVEVKNNDLRLTYKNGDHLNLYIDKDGLKIREKTANKQAYLNPLFVAKNFMNEIKKGEYSSALNYLAPSLKEIHSQASLQEFFGEISFVFPIDLYNVFAISNDKEKIYTFEIDKGEIVDISD